MCRWIKKIALKIRMSDRCHLVVRYFRETENPIKFRAGSSTFVGLNNAPATLGIG